MILRPPGQAAKKSFQSAKTMMKGNEKSTTTTTTTKSFSPKQVGVG
jgi:plastocyanin domain-containing protein